MRAEPDGEPAIQLGDRNRDQKNWEEAALHYQRHLETHPNDAGILVQLGHMLKESGLYGPAFAAYKRALGLMPDNSDLFLQIGHLAKMVDDRSLMLSHYARSFELDPAAEDPYRELLAYLPRTRQEWQRSLATQAHHVTRDLAPPVEPTIRAASPAADAIADPARAAMDTIRIARAVRHAPLPEAMSSVEQAYAMSKLAVFNSSYDEARDVFAALSGLSGGQLDKATNPMSIFAFGAVPSRRAREQAPLQATPLLSSYSRAQHAATQRMALHPDRRGLIKTGPLISVLMPVYKGPAVYIERAILSVLLQTYQNLELCLVDDCSERSDITALLSYYAAQDPRVRVIVHETNRGIAEATNSAFRLARGDHVGLIDHDDMLAHDALATFAAALVADPSLDLVYSDECKIDGDDIASEIFTKPDWSPALLMSTMYTGHFSVYRAATVRAAGQWRPAYDFSQDYDLALRVAEMKPRVLHLRQCLYGWRMIAGSAAQGDKPLARLSNVAALQAAADRRGLPGRALGMPMSNRFRRSRPAVPPLVSLVIPSDNVANITTTVATLRLMTAYPEIEILVVTNSDCMTACKAERALAGTIFVAYDKPYNFSDKCNEGAKVATGRHLVFFNDDVRATDPEWLDVVLEMLELPEVGLVGPKLLYENGAIQHAGMVTGVRQLVGTAFHTFPSGTGAHFGFAQSTRDVSLICGACLAIKADLFAKIGGFDAVHTPIAHSDVDLCFKVREAGFSCVYTAHTALTHIGHFSIGAAKKSRKKPPATRDKSDIFLLRRWAAFCAYDPYFPPETRDIVYIDSQEPFQLYPGKRQYRAGGNDVMIVSHDLSGSGAPKVAFDIAEHLVSEGHYVLVVSPEDGPFRARLQAIGCDVIVDPLCNTGSNRSFEALAKGFDAVIANTAVTWPVVNQLAQITHVFWYVHETELVGHLARLHPEFAREHRNVTVWAGSKLAAHALMDRGISASVIEYGVTPLKLGSPARRDGKVVVSLLATYEPRKGQDLALLALHLLPKSIRETCVFRFAGRINDKHFHQALLDIDREEAAVEHMGTLSLEDYVEQMAATDIVLCPSRDDTLPLVSLDALANGKILICSRTTGTSAYIEDGVSGYLPRSGSPTEIARTLERALAERDRWDEIAAAAKKVFEENFSRTKFDHRISEALALAEYAAPIDPTLALA